MTLNTSLLLSNSVLFKISQEKDTRGFQISNSSTAFVDVDSSHLSSFLQNVSSHSFYILNKVST